MEADSSVYGSWYFCVEKLNVSNHNLFQGNAELLSISSDDSIWNSEDDNDNDNDNDNDHEEEEDHENDDSPPQGRGLFQNICIGIRGAQQEWRLDE